MRLFLFCFFAASLFAAPLTSYAGSKPVTYDGSLEIRTPIFNSLPGSSYGWFGDKTVFPEMAGTVRFHNLLPGKLVLWVNGEHTFKQYGVYKPENKLRVGLDMPVSHQATLFVYWDRRFLNASSENFDVDRVFAGVRFGFTGKVAP